MYFRGLVAVKRIGRGDQELLLRFPNGARHMFEDLVDCGAATC